MTNILSALLWMIATASADLLANDSFSTEVIETYPPGQMIELPEGGTLYIRLRYHSDQPLRFGADGGSLPSTGRMTNIMPLYPAGQGEALVWVAYRQAQWVNGIPLNVLNAQWQPLASLSVPVQAYWSTDVPTANQARPSWVTQLSQAQQSLNRASPNRTDATSSNVENKSIFSWIGLLWPMIFLLYLFLQYWTWRHWQGVWRIVGIIPLITFTLMLSLSLFALFMKSNLWAIGLVLLVPVLFIYLVAAMLLKLLFARSCSGQ